MNQVKVIFESIMNSEEVINSFLEEIADAYELVDLKQSIDTTDGTSYSLVTIIYKEKFA